MTGNAVFSRQDIIPRVASYWYFTLYPEANYEAGFNACIIFSVHERQQAAHYLHSTQISGLVSAGISFRSE